MPPSQIPSHRFVDAPSGPTAATTGFAAPARPGVALPAVTAPALPNPTLRLDTGLGLVVLEFRDAQGRVEKTLPTERALAAYRTAARTASPTFGTPTFGTPTFGNPQGTAAAPQANSASTPAGAASVAAPAAATT